MATVYGAGGTNQAILLAEASSGSSASGESNNQLSGLTISMVLIWGRETENLDPEMLLLGR